MTHSQQYRISTTAEDLQHVAVYTNDRHLLEYTNSSYVKFVRFNTSYRIPHALNPQ
jgi:hypothetical protein